MGKSEKVYRIFHVAEGTQCSSCDDRNFIGASHKLAHYGTRRAPTLCRHLTMATLYGQFMSWISDTSFIH
jgi:hypothetical protein